MEEDNDLIYIKQIEESNKKQINKRNKRYNRNIGNVNFDNNYINLKNENINELSIEDINSNIDINSIIYINIYHNRIELECDIPFNIKRVILNKLTINYKPKIRTYLAKDEGKLYCYLFDEDYDYEYSNKSYKQFDDNTDINDINSILDKDKEEYIKNRYYSSFNATKWIIEGIDIKFINIHSNVILNIFNRTFDIKEININASKEPLLKILPYKKVSV